MLETVLRPSKDEYYLNIAKIIHTRSTCLRRHYGAVLVNNDEIVATGYNGAPRGIANCNEVGVCLRQQLGLKSGERYELCKSLHAEDNAITSAGRTRCQGATLYLAGEVVETGELANPLPCLMCARKIINAGISRIVGLFPDGSIKEINVENIVNSVNK